MMAERFKSTLFAVTSYIVVALVIVFFSLQVHLLRTALADHRAYIVDRDARWEILFSRVMDTVEHNRIRLDHIESRTMEATK